MTLTLDDASRWQHLDAAEFRAIAESAAETGR